MLGLAVWADLCSDIIDCRMQLVDLLLQLLLCHRRLVLLEPVGSLELLLLIQNSPRDLHNAAFN